MSMPRLFLDCEWNSYQGDLISIALVSDHNSPLVFYRVLDCPSPHPWVAEHVMPRLYRDPCTLGELQRDLEQFLAEIHAPVIIVADWAEDIAHFCRLLITGPGQRIEHQQLYFNLMQIDSESENPHNALADAMGIRKAVITAEGGIP